MLLRILVSSFLCSSLAFAQLPTVLPGPSPLPQQIPGPSPFLQLIPGPLPVAGPVPLVQPNPFSPFPNVVLSAPVSAFISTATQALRDSGIVLPLYNLQATPEDIQRAYYNEAFQSAQRAGNSDPATFANSVYEATIVTPPIRDYEAEMNAGTYTIGQLLEDKGLLPDVNTAIAKANQFFSSEQSQVNALPLNPTWTQYFAALNEGSRLFMRNNLKLTPIDNNALRDRFFNQLPPV